MAPEFETKVTDFIQEKNIINFDPEDGTELNSYRFPKHRIYNPN
jgi:hypothetical protein